MRLSNATKKIYIPGGEYGHEIDLEEFRSHPLGQDPLAQLFFQLLEEKIWSGPFGVNLYLPYGGRAYHLTIYSEAFPEGPGGHKALTITDPATTMNTVKKQVTSYLAQEISGMTSAIAILNNRKSEVEVLLEATKRDLVAAAFKEKLPDVKFNSVQRFADVYTAHGANKVYIVKAEEMSSFPYRVYEVLHVNAERFPHVMLFGDNEECKSILSNIREI